MKLKKIISVFCNLAFRPKPFVRNFFNKTYRKKVLISYITEPFTKGISFKHSSHLEAVKIAKIFNKMRYSIDIIQYNANFEKIDFDNSKYDLIFGLEPNFFKAVNKFKPKKSIYYATGAHYLFQNKAEEERLKNLKKRKGVLLRPIRYVKPHDSSSIADGVICIGNEWTKSTYKGHCKKIETINVSAYSFFPYPKIKKEKKWELVKKNFLWFGSHGAVHKGLDLLLDVFLKHSEINLYICGGIENEEDFVMLYRQELYNSPNIHFIGWVNPDSEQFRKLVIKCGYSILPSCSEGMSSAVATTMHSGLIPIVSKQSGINCRDCGIVLQNNSLDFLEKIIIDLSKKSDDWLQKMSKKSYEKAKKNYTISKFERDFKRALKKML